METLQQPPLLELHPDDQLWMANYGATVTWEDDPVRLAELQALVALGSQHIDKNDNELRRREIVEAREDFFEIAGLKPATIEAFRKTSATLAPIDTFIGSQRVMYKLGLNAVKVVDTLPSAIGYTARSVGIKFTNFTDLGLDAVKIINAFPPAIGLSIKSVQERFTNLIALGLDAVKILNSQTSAIGYAPQSVRNKFTSLTDLGLNAVKIFNKESSVISKAPKLTHTKARFLKVIIKALKWEFSSEEFIEANPAILGFNMKKLYILSRIAAEQLTADDRKMSPALLRTYLATPLENYLLAIPLTEEAVADKARFLTKAKKLKLNAEERKKQALDLALTGQLGRIGVMYLDYVNYSSEQSA